MITRYSRPEMRAIWTDENKLKIWLQIELLASEALVKEKIVPAKDFAKIKAGCDKWFADLPGLVARQRELEKVLNHDVIGFTTAVAEKIDSGSAPVPGAESGVAPESSSKHKVTRETRKTAGETPALPSRWFHFGLTSSDVSDTCYSVQMIQSADILIADVKALRKSIAKRAKEFQFTPCIGRSHGIHAEPTTFGLKLAHIFQTAQR